MRELDERKQKNKRFFRWLPAIFWMAAIFYSSSLQSSGKLFLPDYVLHFIVYSILAATYFFAFSSSVINRNKLFAFCVSLTAFYGLSDEFHQSFVPTRTATFEDLAVDVLAGVIILALLIYFPSIGRRTHLS